MSAARLHRGRSSVDPVEMARETRGRPVETVAPRRDFAHDRAAGANLVAGAG